MIKGDKIRLKAKMGVFDNIGEICEVSQIELQVKKLLKNCL